MTTKTRTRKWASWKREVLSMIRGHSPTTAARIIRENAETSRSMGELSNANYEKALTWADVTFWKKTKFIA
jgi:hypothetical protein